MSHVFEDSPNMPLDPLALEVSKDIIMSYTSSSVHNRSSMDSKLDGSKVPPDLLTMVVEQC